jgi:hypothetical protein
MPYRNGGGNEAEMKADQQPVFVVALRAQANVDGYRAMRALLKSALRKHGLRCIAIRPPLPDESEDSPITIRLPPPDR